MDQGLLGALEQFWTVEPKPRLGRKNTYFEDLKFTDNWTILKIVLGLVSIGIAIMVFWSVRWIL